MLHERHSWVTHSTSGAKKCSWFLVYSVPLVAHFLKHHLKWISARILLNPDIFTTSCSYSICRLSSSVENHFQSFNLKKKMAGKHKPKTILAFPHTEVWSKYFIIYLLELQSTEDWRRLVKGISVSALNYSYTLSTLQCVGEKRETWWTHAQQI